MIACNRPLDINTNDRQYELWAQNRRPEPHKATPFASAAIARANGSFVFSNELHLVAFFEPGPIS